MPHGVEGTLFGALALDLKLLDLVVLNGSDNVLTQEVLRHRVLVYRADHSYRVAWEVSARYRIWDMDPYKARYVRALHERILGRLPGNMMILVHMYSDIDLGRVCMVLSEGRADIRAFMMAVVSHVN